MTLKSLKKCEWRDGLDEGEQYIGEPFRSADGKYRYPFGYAIARLTVLGISGEEWVDDLTPDEIQSAVAGLYALQDGV